MSPLSASGARIRGNDYQHLFGWCKALEAIQPGSDIVTLGIEDPGAGNVDDVTIYRSQGRNEFYQVKSSATLDKNHLVNIDWLTKPSPAGGPSMLERFYVSWRDLTLNGQLPKLGLVTNRPCDPHDAVIPLRDGRNGTVAVRLSEARASTPAGKARADLAKILQTNEAGVIEFLRDLHFTIGRLQDDWEEHAAWRMFSLGFRHDRKAIHDGITIVRGWVMDGKRKLSPDEIRRDVDTQDLVAGSPFGVLLVQAIARDTIPEGATVTLDWVDLYQGDEPTTRYKLYDNRLWNQLLRPEIQTAARTLRTQGHQRVLVRGNMRLPLWFTVGNALGRTAGFDVTSFQNGEEWASKGETRSYPVAVLRNEHLGHGGEIAVGAVISFDLSEEVLDYLKSQVPSVGRYICVAPETVPSNYAIHNATEARGWAEQMRNHVRELVREYKPEKVHLFLATPQSAALLLGHLWDRMRHTQLYEYQGPGKGYLPSFLIPN